MSGAAASLTVVNNRSRERVSDRWNLDERQKKAVECHPRPVGDKAHLRTDCARLPARPPNRTAVVSIGLLRLLRALVASAPKTSAITYGLRGPSRQRQTSRIGSQGSEKAGLCK